MTNEEYIEEMLIEAEEYQLRNFVINESSKVIAENPDIARVDAIKLILDYAKIHGEVIQ
jgi:hypothetical protein